MTELLELRAQHLSLQFTDKPEQQRHDVQLLFASAQNYPLKTGTEAGRDARGLNTNRDLLEEFAEEFNHAIMFGGDSWVAVDRSIVKKGSLTRDKLFIADSSEIEVSRGHDRVMPFIEFDHVDPRIGHVAQGAIHYPTKGDRPGTPNYDLNRKCARACNKWMVEKGAGRAIALLNGDFNMNDETLDFSFDGHFSTMADELDAHQNTGHGPIDGMASYEEDGRVSALTFRVKKDKKKFYFTDHFECRGVWGVRPLKIA